jgi:hypothetical protein
MKILLAGAAALVLLTPVVAMADGVPSGVDGTWKAVLDSAKTPKKPDVIVIKDGLYDCQTCTPAFKIKADGSDQAVKGSPYFDSAAIKLTDHGVTEIDKKAGKTVTTTVTTVSADGKTASSSFHDISASTTPIVGKVMLSRVGMAAAGEHPYSGSWHTDSYSGISDSGLTVTYKTSGGALSMTTPAGQSYTAKLDGTAAPYKGDPGTDSVSVKMDGKSLVETDMRAGKVIGIATSTPSSDGKSIAVTVDNKLSGKTLKFTADKVM